MAKLVYNFLLALGTGFFVAYDIIYFEHFGLGLAAIALASSMYDLSSALSDLPLSAVFDRISPRFVLLLGNAARITGFVLFFSDPSNITLVIVGQVLAGIGGASESGAVEALVINERLSRGDSARSAVATLLRLNAGATVVGAGIGYLLYSWNPPMIWLAAAAVYLVSTVLLFSMSIDAPEELESGARPSNLWTSSLVAVKILLRRREAWMIILGNAAALGAFFTWQSKFYNIDDSALMVLAALIVMKVGVFLASFVVDHLNLGRIGLAATIVVNCGGLALLALSTSPVALVIAFLAHVAAQAVLIESLGSALHEELPNGVRATAFSMLACMDSLAVVLVGPLVGLAAEHISLAAGIAASSVLYLPILVVLLLKQDRRVLRQEDTTALQPEKGPS